MIRDGWVACPKCKRKLFPVSANTTIRNLAFKCRHCGHILQVNTWSHEPLSHEPMNQ